MEGVLWSVVEIIGMLVLLAIALLLLFAFFIMALPFMIVGGGYALWKSLDEQGYTTLGLIFFLLSIAIAIAIWKVIDTISDSGMSHTSTRKEKRRSKKKEGKKTGIVKCPDCYSVGTFPGVDSGDGNCRKCEGVGKTPDLLEAVSRSLVGASQNCDICHGSGKCQTCRGKGYVNVGIFG